MNSCDIHTVLTRIRDHLDENDRLRLNFVLGDLNQISKEDVNELIKSFEEINCDEAVRLLKGNNRMFHRMIQYTLFRIRLFNV